jgi:hypothetical protein
MLKLEVSAALRPNLASKYLRQNSTEVSKNLGKSLMDSPQMPQFLLAKLKR